MEERSSKMASSGKKSARNHPNKMGSLGAFESESILPIPTSRKE